MIPLLVILIGCLLLLEAFFSGSEMALISCDRIKIRHLAGEGVTGAQVAERLLQRPDRLLATTLVGTNLCVVTSSTAATVLCLFLLGEGREYYATVLLAPLVLLFGEMVPKAYFRQHADRLTPLLAPPLHLCLRLFAPLTTIVHRASTVLLTPLRIAPSERDP
ncbi:MAG TPA: CNNM domain-containing protein, partial [Candidatus Methylomirabilis sp.]|nr:CNNM domain-containing protein [Candidatus Methylomirabilis sp.]